MFPEYKILTSSSFEKSNCSSPALSSPLLSIDISLLEEIFNARECSKSARACHTFNSVLLLNS